MSQKSDKKENSVTVGVRIRPRNEKEITAGMPVSFAPSADFRDVQELNEDQEVSKHWSYDHVFGPDHNNQYIFEAMGARLVDSALDGYNSVLFMYGQTSSGKTFTLFGGGSTAGLVQHAMEYLYQRIMASPDTEYVVRLTYAELYNEELKDLLATGTADVKLSIREDPTLGPVIDGITEVGFTNPGDMKKLLDDGENRRHFGVTNMNAHSSRSHVLVRLSIESRKVNARPTHPLRLNWGKADKPSLISTLNLVDLAGSERASKSGTSGASLKEGAFINKSLLSLGTVISHLSENKGAYINYRESKLTRLLSAALGGNAKTSMITCISPASGNIGESLSTLRFASRAKHIVNQVTRNEVVTMKTLMQKLEMANGEMDKLRSQLELSRQMGYVVDEDGMPGETVKDKAVAVSRNMRNLLFLTTHGAKVAAGLKKAGMLQLAKKVQSDLVAVQRGARRDLNAVIEEHSDLIITYLKHDRKLNARLQLLAEENETDHLFGEGDDAELYSEDGDDVPNIDTEELREQLEGANLYSEEVRAVAVAHLDQLYRDLSAAALREREARDLVVSLQSTIIEHEDTINRHLTNERTLQNTINKTQAELEEEHRENKQRAKKIASLEGQLSEYENTINRKDHDVVAREAEIVRFRTAAEQLERDLATANQQKKLLEEEFSRQRNDMRAQMEKMRGNMHTMLQHGGDQVKMLEIQIDGLQTELESVKDILEEVSRSKERLELEMSHLRGNIAMLQDEQRVHISEMNVSRKECAELAQKVKDSRWKLIKISSALTVSEEHNAKVTKQFNEQLAEKEEQLTNLQTELRARHDQLEAKCNAAIVRADKAQSELTAAYEQIDHKNATIQRLEQTLSADTARLEKKLHAQTKHNEELAADLANSHAFLQSQTAKHMEETKTLRAKVAELQGIVDEVNRHIQEQVDAIDAAHAAEDSSGSSSPTAGTPYSPYRSENGGTPYSRHDSFSGDYVYSPMLRSVSFVLKGRQSFPRMESTDSADGSASNTMWNGEGLTEVTEVTEVDESGGETKSDAAAATTSRNAAGGSNTPSAAVTPMRSALKGGNGAVSAHRQHQQRLTIETQSPPRDASTTPIAYWEPPEEYSAQFQRVYAGLQLLTTVMTQSMNEERTLRDFLMNHHAQLMEQTSADHETIVFLEGRKDGLEEKTSYQQESLDYAKESERRALERVAQAESDYQQLSAKYQQMVRCEQAALGAAAKYEQLYRDLELQAQKLRNERKHLMDTGMDNNTHCVELELKIEEQAEAYSVLQSELMTREQELAVLTAERDELVKRCLRNGLPGGKSGTAVGTGPGTGGSGSDDPPSPPQARGGGNPASPVRGGASEPSSTLQRGLPGLTNAGPATPAATGPVRSSGLMGRTPSFLSSPLPSSARDGDQSRTSATSSLATPAPASRVYYENTYGRYSTLTPQDRQPSEAFVSMFGSHTKQAGRN